MLVDGKYACEHNGCTFECEAGRQLYKHRKEFPDHEPQEVVTRREMARRRKIEKIITRKRADIRDLKKEKIILDHKYPNPIRRRASPGEAKVASFTQRVDNLVDPPEPAADTAPFVLSHPEGGIVTRFCPGCGKSNENGGEFCSSCGRCLRASA